MKKVRILSLVMTVILCMCQPMAVLAENVEETVSETNSDAMVQENTEQEAEAEQDNGEPTENIENQENIETEENQSEDTDQLNEVRDQSSFVENSFRYSNGEVIENESISEYASRDVSQAYKKINGVCYNYWGDPVEGATGKVIDVSEHNGEINWEKVKKSDVDFVILRVGYGNNVTYQDDKRWQYNVSECTRLGIPFGVYIYSYAENTAEAESEADHVLRLISGYNLAYPVYYDLEDNSQIKLGNTLIKQIAETFCNKISNAGYQVGVYANLNWWNNYLTDSVYNKWHRWVAQYHYQCDYTGKYEMWQCTSEAKVNGISTNVDVSFYYGNLTGDADVNTPVVDTNDVNIISYSANIQNIGWTSWKKNGYALGTIGESLRVEALKIQTNHEYLGVKYSGLIADYGWSEEAQNGEMLGTVGKSKALEAVKISLTGESAGDYDIYYRVHSSNFGWLGWAKNGEKAGTEDYGYAIEAIQIAILPHGSSAPGSTSDVYRYNESWNELSVKYTAHVQNIGWQTACYNNQETAGTVGENLRLEALQVSLSGHGFSGGISYSTHVENIGWQSTVSNGKTAGTTGQNKRIEAIKIWLTGDIAKKYDVYYRAHVQNFGWLDWAKNGEIAGSVNYGYRMEAIKIVLVRKDGQAPTPTGNSSRTFETQAVYNAHVQNIGWQRAVNNGEIIGTVGQGLRMEALKVELYKPLYSGNITYSAHVQNIGWQSFKKNGELAGTTGMGLRMEAVKINLTGEMKEHYDIYYRAHVQNFGWLDWTKNGEEAGTTGMGYELEAIQIKIVLKSDKSIKVGSAPFKSR